MKTKNTIEHSMDLAEESRQQEWKHPSFAAELFRGRFRWKMISPFPEQNYMDKMFGDEYIEVLRDCITQHIDPEKVDQEQQLPQEAIDALIEAGAFRMKIPKKYGGLGLSNMNYARAISFIATYCSSTAVWLSAHQSIGVPQPLKLYGTEDQKRKYFPKLVKGAISAFALTEPGVGSDPAHMQTRADLSEDGTYYLLNGTKQWCTNGPDADLIIIMALTKPKIVRGKERKQISAFLLNMDTPGVHTQHSCQFMGIRGISNGIIRFENVRIPAENLLGEEGIGLKIALETLNSGRLIIPACSAAVGKYCMHVSREWANKREQWGSKIGQHQAVAQMLSDISCETYAMDSMALLATSMADQNRFDIRLEAAMAKYFGSESAWKVIDQALQVRGGRGYETASSLEARGEEAIPLERIMRDIRINRIIEGSSEIMRLFIAREALDPHVKLIMPLMKAGSLGVKMKAVARMLGHYALWYPRLWFPKFNTPGSSFLNRKNRRHLRFLSRTSRKMARKLFHVMMRYQNRLQDEQLILGHFVDTAVLLFTMSATLSRTEQRIRSHGANGSLQELTDTYCRKARREIQDHFKALKKENRRGIKQTSKHLLEGNYAWMEEGIYRYNDPRPEPTEKQNINVKDKKEMV